MQPISCEIVFQLLSLYSTYIYPALAAWTLVISCESRALAPQQGRQEGTSEKGSMALLGLYPLGNCLLQQSMEPGWAKGCKYAEM